MKWKKGYSIIGLILVAIAASGLYMRNLFPCIHNDLSPSVRLLVRNRHADFQPLSSENLQALLPYAVIEQDNAMRDHILFTPDSQYLIAGGRDIIAYNSDHSLESCGTIWKWAVDETQVSTLNSQNENILDLRISGNSRWLLLSELRPSLITEFSLSPLAPLQEGRSLLTGSYASAAAFSPNSEFLAYAVEDSGIHFWDLFENSESHLRIAPTTYVGQIAYSDDGNLIAFSNTIENTVSIWSLIEDREIASFQSGMETIGWLSFANDDQSLLFADLEDALPAHSVKQWNLAAGEVLDIFDGIPFKQLLLRSNGEILFGIDTSNQIYQWSVQQNRLLSQQQLDSETLSEVEISPDGQIAIAPITSSASDSLRFGIWSLETGALLRDNVMDDVTENTANQIQSIAISSDQTQLAIAVGFEDHEARNGYGAVYIWVIPAGTQDD